MTELFGLTLIYGVPALLAYVFWAGPIKRLIGAWTGRDVMLSFIPKAHDVHVMEKLLGIRTRPTQRKSAFLALLSEYGDSRHDRTPTHNRR